MSQNTFIFDHFVILLLERHTEMERVLRPALFQGFYAALSGNSIPMFGDNQSVSFLRVKMSKKNSLDNQQRAHT
jgi:hypothetical protein